MKNVYIERILIIAWGEILKQHRNNFHSKANYCTLLIWPIVLLASAYYSYMPFGFTSVNSKILIFLITGFLCYVCFFSLVRSALFMRNERENGMLELILLSPANRLALIYGRALGTLIENIWMFSLFSFIVYFFMATISVKELLFIPIAFLLLCISACVWGAFINVIFLFTRDATVIFNILDEPMSLFSGVRIPVEVFPLWGKAISSIFPLTYVLMIVRGILMGLETGGLLICFFVLVLVLVFIIAITIYLLKVAERHLSETGEYTFY